MVGTLSFHLREWEERAQVRSPSVELRFHVPCSLAKKMKKVKVTGKVDEFFYFFFGHHATQLVGVRLFISIAVLFL